MELPAAILPPSKEAPSVNGAKCEDGAFVLFTAVSPGQKTGLAQSGI